MSFKVTMSFFRRCVVNIPNILYMYITSDPQNVKNACKIYKIVLKIKICNN